MTINKISKEAFAAKVGNDTQAIFATATGDVLFNPNGGKRTTLLRDDHSDEDADQVRAVLAFLMDAKTAQDAIEVAALRALNAANVIRSIPDATPEALEKAADTMLELGVNVRPVWALQDARAAEVKAAKAARIAAIEAEPDVTASEIVR